MIIFINGSYGVGKTTVGRILKERLDGSVLYNPEWTGSILMRLPFKFKGSGTDDFQDLYLWRESVVEGIKIFRKIARRNVIVPMTFYRKNYFDEIAKEVRKFDDNIKMFCLTASFETILKRLENRGEQIESGDNNWSAQKAKLCVEAFQSKSFGEIINTENITASDAANEILRSLRS